MKKKTISFIMGMILSVTTVFGSVGFSSVTVSAAEAGITDSQCTDNGTAEPEPDETVPNDNQYKYQKDELAAFCHFGPNTFNELEWGFDTTTQSKLYAGKTEAQIFPHISGLYCTICPSRTMDFAHVVSSANPSSFPIQRTVVFVPAPNSIQSEVYVSPVTELTAPFPSYFWIVLYHLSKSYVCGRLVYPLAPSIHTSTKCPWLPYLSLLRISSS